MMFHAKDDPYVPNEAVERFAARTGIKLNSLQRGDTLGQRKLSKLTGAG
jgi:hypothetical protein